MIDWKNLTDGTSIVRYIITALSSAAVAWTISFFVADYVVQAHWKSYKDTGEATNKHIASLQSSVDRLNSSVNSAVASYQSSIDTKFNSLTSRIDKMLETTSAMKERDFELSEKIGVQREEMSMLRRDFNMLNKNFNEASNNLEKIRINQENSNSLKNPAFNYALGLPVNSRENTAPSWGALVNKELTEEEIVDAARILEEALKNRLGVTIMDGALRERLGTSGLSSMVDFKDSIKTNNLFIEGAIRRLNPQEMNAAKRILRSNLSTIQKEKRMLELLLQ